MWEGERGRKGDDRGMETRYVCWRRMRIPGIVYTVLIWIFRLGERERVLHEPVHTWIFCRCVCVRVSRSLYISFFVLPSRGYATTLRMIIRQAWWGKTYFAFRELLGIIAFSRFLPQCSLAFLISISLSLMRILGRVYIVILYRVNYAN